MLNKSNLRASETQSTWNAAQCERRVLHGLLHLCGAVQVVRSETSHGPPERNEPMTQEENLHGDIPLHHNNDGLAGQLCAAVNWSYLRARSKLPTVLADRASGWERVSG